MKKGDDLVKGKGFEIIPESCLSLNPTFLYNI